MLVGFRHRIRLVPVCKLVHDDVAAQVGNAPSHLDGNGRAGARRHGLARRVGILRLRLAVVKQHRRRRLVDQAHLHRLADDGNRVLHRRAVRHSPDCGEIPGHGNRAKHRHQANHDHQLDERERRLPCRSFCCVRFHPHHFAIVRQLHCLTLSCTLWRTAGSTHCPDWSSRTSFRSAAARSHVCCLP